MKEGKIGINQEIYLTNALDVWTPETRGSSSRVFFGSLANGNGQLTPAAIKIMRQNERNYALPLFIEEIQILKKMEDVPGVVKMLEYGLLMPDDDYEFPTDMTRSGCESLSGEVIRINSNEEFNKEYLEQKASIGWLPYIAMNIKNHQDNLLMLCDRARTPGHKPFPMRFAVQSAIQICEILAQAHARNIVYLDHKILHYYWNKNLSRTYVLDWNVGKIHKELSDANKKFDIIQLGARTIHFIFAGRPAPGALSLGPTRPDEIQNDHHQYSVDWREYDDKHISSQIKDIISAMVKGEYIDALILKDDISSCQNGEK